jgi:hypothetical protein
MGCLLCCFEKINLEEPIIHTENFEIQLCDYYINYYLATRFDLWD